jgi:hypothetical protein
MTTDVTTIYDIKRSAKLSTTCPVCKAEIKYGVEMELLRNVTKFPYAHIVLHGDPLHAIIIYLDANFTARGVESAESIEIVKESGTLNQILRKWSNPF